MAKQPKIRLDQLLVERCLADSRAKAQALIMAGLVHGPPETRPRVATVAVDGFIFHKPVNVGDVLCCYAEVIRVGTTSIAIRIEAWALRQRAKNRRVRVTEGIFTFVALDESGQKRAVPKD